MAVGVGVDRSSLEVGDFPGAVSGADKVVDTRVGEGDGAGDFIEQRADRTTSVTEMATELRACKRVTGYPLLLEGRTAPNGLEMSRPASSWSLS